MVVDLTPEQERLVQEELRLGHYRSAEEVIGRALEALCEKERQADGRRRAVQEMLEFAEKNRTPLEGMSVKDLIHEGHRL